MDNLPIAFSNSIRVKGSTRSDLSVDRERSHSDAVGFQVGSEHRGRRSKSGLAQPRSFVRPSADCVIVAEMVGMTATVLRTASWT